MSQTCRSARCRAPIFFVRSAATGKSMPLDVEPTEQGNITISQDLLGEDVATVDPDGPMPRYTSHFATCPDAPTFRRD